MEDNTTIYFSGRSRILEFRLLKRKIEQLEEQLLLLGAGRDAPGAVFSGLFFLGVKQQEGTGVDKEAWLATTTTTTTHSLFVIPNLLLEYSSWLVVLGPGCDEDGEEEGPVNLKISGA
jgi:hypothetical protein